MISILIPIYNSEKSIFLLVEKIVNTFKNLEYEINMVNDASNDNTHEECIKLINKYPKLINYIKLRKNVGEHNAVMAGLNHSNGEWIIIMTMIFKIHLKKLLSFMNMQVVINLT